MDADITELIECLFTVEYILCEESHNGAAEETATNFSFLRSVLQSSEFLSLYKIHNTLNKAQNDIDTEPRATNLHTLIGDICWDIERAHQHSKPGNLHNLYGIISDPQMDALFSAHDSIAKKEYTETLQTHLNDDGGYIDIPLLWSPYTIILQKDEKPLGLTVKRDESRDALVVSRILHGGVAYKSGQLQKGDHLLSVNNTSLNGMSLNEAANIITAIPKGPISLLVVRTEHNPHYNAQNNIGYYRALFDYNPATDLLLPCKEAGLSLAFGNILKVVDTRDEGWWQAQIEGNEREQARLIPSYKTVEKHYILKELYSASRPNQIKTKYLIRRSRLLNAIKKQDIASFEEIIRVSPEMMKYRPIIIVGTKSIDKRRLVNQLVTTYPFKYSTCIPHTTRPPLAGEINGRDCYFISRQEMLMGIASNKFYEYSKFRDVYYGTSINTIRQMRTNAKTCIFTCTLSSLKILRKSELKPYIIYITDTDISMREHKYRHYFDDVIIFHNENYIFQKITLTIEQLQNNYQWVPVSLH